MPTSSPREPKQPPTRRPAAPGRRLALWVVIVAASVFVVDSLVGDRGLLAMLRARQEFEQLAATIASERSRNARLRYEVRRLRDDPGVIEEIARRDLGLMKAGETIFIVKDIPPPSK